MKSARLLIKGGNYESAMSRVYYAMFYCVEAVLLNKRLSFSSHKAVISTFGEHFVKTEIFPNLLSRLCEGFKINLKGVPVCLLWDQ